jgi:polar amino acid transport system substrate-binding protein
MLAKLFFIFSSRAYLPVLAVFLLLTGIPNNTLQAQELAIRTIGFSPYGFIERGVSQGIYFDVANLLMKNSGYKGINTVAPYSRIKAELITGMCDLTIMFKYPELQEYVHYISPLPALKVVVIGLSGSRFQSLQSLKGKRIAYLRGASFSDLIDDDTDIKIIRTTDLLQGVRMLQAGHVDGVIGPLDPIYRAAADLSRGPEMFGEPFVVSVRTPWVQVSKASKFKIDRLKLKSAYKRLNEQGVFKTLRDKYLLLKDKP